MNRVEQKRRRKERKIEQTRGRT